MINVSLLPKKFLNNMQTLLKDEFALFLKEYEKEYYKGLRFNNSKNINIKEILNDLNLKNNKKIPYTNGIFIEPDCKLGNNAYHHAGLFYIQEPSAMLPALCVKFKKDDIVLDLCSAPGGKSSQIAEQIPQGVLVSNEIITNRALILKENLIRLGFLNCIVTSSTPENICKFGKIFDKVLVDAPCSGEGLFRKEEESINEWNENINEMNAERQLSILNCAKEVLRNGGSIIYSTCTFSRIENENVIKKFLEQNKNFKLGKIEQNVIDNTCAGIDNIGRRVYPHKNCGEGQFMCVLENIDEQENLILKKSNLHNLTFKEKTIVDKFIKENFKNFDKTLKCYNDTIYVVPKFELNTKDIYTIKYGVIFGKIEKDRFVPNHNMFTSLGTELNNIINLKFGDEKIIKYLKGESIEVPNSKNGYACICINSYPLGGVKITNERANNLYPKHLRIK